MVTLIAVLVMLILLVMLVDEVWQYVRERKHER